jgi:hypothetical protein
LADIELETHRVIKRDASGSHSGIEVLSQVKCLGMILFHAVPCSYFISSPRGVNIGSTKRIRWRHEESNGNTILGIVRNFKFSFKMIYRQPFAFCGGVKWILFIAAPASVKPSIHGIP